MQESSEIEENAAPEKSEQFELHAFEAFILKTTSHTEGQPYQDDAEAHQLQGSSQKVTRGHSGIIEGSETTEAKPLVILPTYNEFRNLPELCAAIFQNLPSTDILVVDDASPDGTGRWVAERRRYESRLHLLSRPKKMGLGSAYRTGWLWALKRAYDPIITMDADFSHPPERLPDLLALWQQGADLAIGSRYVTGGGVRDWPWHRRVLSRGANGLTRFLLRIPVRDATAGFRAYRASGLRRMDPMSIQAEGYSFLEETLWRAHQVDLQLAETPILFCDRTRDQSKIDRREIWLGMVTLLRLFRQSLQDRLRRARRRRPRS